MEILAQPIFYQADTAKGYAWIQFAFAQPQTIKAITMVGGGNPGRFWIGRSIRKTAASWKQVMMGLILNGFVLFRRALYCNKPLPYLQPLQNIFVLQLKIHRRL